MENNKIDSNINSNCPKELKGKPTHRLGVEYEEYMLNGKLMRRRVPLWELLSRNEMKRIQGI